MSNLPVGKTIDEAGEGDVATLSMLNGSRQITFSDLSVSQIQIFSNRSANKRPLAASAYRPIEDIQSDATGARLSAN